MIRCPKCGSYQILGPTYIKGSLGELGDRLRYQCLCGYSRDELTLDAPYKDVFENAKKVLGESK